MTRVRGAAAVLVAKTDLAQPCREGGRILAVHADLGGGRGDLVQDALLDGRAAGALLERGRIRLGDAVEPVLALDQLAGLLSHRGPDSRFGKRLECREQGVLL